MGIQGLSKYIYDSINVFSTRLVLNEAILQQPDDQQQRRSSPTSPHRPFVIDAYSLIYHLYSDTKALEYISGGENMLFSSIVAHFLRDLLVRLREGMPEERDVLQRQDTAHSEVQNSSPPLIYIVMEGSASQTKAETWRKRMQKKIDKAANLWRKKFLMVGSFFLPPFSIDAASAVMKMFAQMHSNEVQMLWAPGEADDLIALTASQHNAYILSSDSDFMLYTGGNIAGFCALQFMKWTKKFDEEDSSTSAGSFSFAVLTQQDIAKRLHIPQDLLPMVAVLAGNDHFTGDFVEEFHETLAELFKGRMKFIQRIAKFIREASKSQPKSKDSADMDAFLSKVYGDAFRNGGLGKRALSVHHSYQMEYVQQSATRKSATLDQHQGACHCLWYRGLNHMYFDKKYLPYQPIENVDTDESIQEYLSATRQRLYTWMFFNPNSTYKDSATTVTEYFRKHIKAVKMSLPLSRADFASMFSTQVTKAYQKAFPKHSSLCQLLHIFKFPPQFVQDVLNAGLPLCFVALFISLWMLQKRWSGMKRLHLESILVMFCSKRKSLRPIQWKDLVGVQMPQDSDNLPPISVKQFEYMPEVYEFLTALKTVSIVNAYFGFPLCQAYSPNSITYCITDLTMHFSGQQFKYVRTRVDKDSNFIKAMMQNLPERNRKMLDLGHRVMRAAGKVDALRQKERM